MGQTNTYKLKMSTCLLEAWTHCTCVNVSVKRQWKKIEEENQIKSSENKSKKEGIHGSRDTSGSKQY